MQVLIAVSTNNMCYWLCQDIRYAEQYYNQLPVDWISCALKPTTAGKHSKNVNGEKTNRMPFSGLLTRFSPVEQYGSAEIYKSKIVNSKDEVINLSNIGYDCQSIGNREWLMRKKYWGKYGVKPMKNLFIRYYMSSYHGSEKK